MDSFKACQGLIIAHPQRTLDNALAGVCTFKGISASIEIRHNREIVAAIAAPATRRIGIVGYVLSDGSDN